MVRFRMEIAGEVQVDRAIARFAEGCSDYRTVWPQVMDEFYAEERDQFQSEGAAGGQGWQPLSPAYLQWKERHYPGQPIMRRTGALESSLTSATDANAVALQGRTALALGSRVQYALYHQSLEPRTRLPRRPLVQLTEQFARTVMRLFQVYLVDVATAAGLRGGLTSTQMSSLIARTGSGIPPRQSLERKVQRKDHALVGGKHG